MNDYHDYGSISESGGSIFVHESNVLANEEVLENIAEAFSSNLPDDNFIMDGTITQHSPSYATMSFEIKYEDGDLSSNFEDWNEDCDLSDDECECEYCEILRIRILHIL